MSTLQDIERTASVTGLNMFGIAAPVLAIRWCIGKPVEGAAGSLSLSIGDGDEWVAPASGVLFFGLGGEHILMPDGTPAPANVAVFRLHAQVYLRIARLIRAVMEGGNDGLPIRPAPLYFVYSGANATTAQAASFQADPPMALTGGTMTIHDVRGLPIDPVVVAEILDTLIDTFSVLEARAVLSTPPTPPGGRQIHTTAALGDSGVRVHLVDPHGHPATRDQLQGLQDLAGAPSG